MTCEDYDAVMGLWRVTPGIGLDDDSDSREGIERYLKRNPGLSFVAVEDGTIVGAVLCGHDGRRGYLNHLAVATSHRNRGIGKALTARCLDALAKRNIPRCNIFLFRSNAAGQAFWEHNGWESRENLSLMQRKT
jgi:ribosomal protein S18 acetylase RimI-like enzyme